MDNDVIDKVPFKVLDNLVERVKTQPVLKDRLDEAEVSLEFVLGSLFPNAFNNVKEAMKNHYTAGYIAGAHDNLNGVVVPYACPDCGRIWFVPNKMHKYYCPYCGSEFIEG